MRDVISRVDALFVEREIFLRADGRVRFVRITRAAQLRVAGLVAVALLCWGAATLALLGWQVGATVERGQVASDRAAVARDAAAVARYRRSAGSMVDDIARRQDLIEQVVKARLGTPAPSPAPTGKPIAALPDRATLTALAARQDAFAGMLADGFDRRSADAAATLRQVGLNPDALLARGANAKGGPLDPLPSIAMTPALKHLLAAADRWGVLADNLAALPSGRPTDGTPVSSSYGVRGDPFTGAPAFHAGLDFLGSYGQPIRAAAAGRVVFTGQRSGYGNVVEIDHGNGLLTRYAHLSGFDARVGQTVARGQQVARMGSTGRSTGTHLHFEVRVGGNPVNPRRFLSLAQEMADVR